MEFVSIHGTFYCPKLLRNRTIDGKLGYEWPLYIWEEISVRRVLSGAHQLPVLFIQCCSHSWLALVVLTSYSLPFSLPSSFHYLDPRPLPQSSRNEYAGVVEGSLVSSLLEAGLPALLRYLLDDGTDAVRTAAIQCIHGLLVSPLEEVCTRHVIDM